MTKVQFLSCLNALHAYIGIVNEEVEILDSLHKHAKFLRSSRDPRKARVAADWEIFFEQRLVEAKRMLLADESKSKVAA